MMEVDIMMSFIKGIENKQFFEQMVAITDALIEAGYKEVYRVRKQGKKNIENIYYVGEKYVFIVIYNRNTNVMGYSLVDYDFYKSIIEVDSTVICNIMMRTMKDFKVVLRNKKYRNAIIHRLVISCEGKQVDHISHVAFINIAEYLRPCTNQQNCLNKKFYSKVADNEKAFSLPVSIFSSEDKISLLGKGFVVKKKRIFSPEYSTTREMYEALNKFETKYLGEFRYNPLIDFSETWYALVITKCLGGSDLELMEYNRDFMIQNHPDIAKYYQLEV